MKGNQLLSLGLLILFGSVAATPDCYDFSVTTLNTTYFEMLPEVLYYG